MSYYAPCRATDLDPPDQLVHPEADRMMSTKFPRASAWLDDDGRHVWIRHQCQSREVEDMLPWPTWQAVDGEVRPSVMCDACGLHAFLDLRPARRHPGDLDFGEVPA